MASLEMNVRQVNSDFQAIKNKIVENGVEVPVGTKTADYAEKVDDVFSAGQHSLDGDISEQSDLIDQITEVLENKSSIGYDKGYAIGMEDGKSAEWNEFWDVYQENGYRTNYSFAFGGYGWRNSVYNPKYPIVATNTAYSTFYNTGITDTKVPIVIDTTGTVGSLFNWSNIQRIPSIKITEKVTNVDWFAGCSGLEVLNVTEDSVIAVSGMNLTYCTKLTHDSLMSIINALKNYAGSGTTYTVTLGSTNLAKLTNEEKQIATQKGWTLA